MTLTELPVADRVDCLCELLSCTGSMYRWVYDPKGEIQDTNCPDLVLHNVFSNMGYLTQMLDYARTQREPVVFSIPLGLMWGCAFEYEDEALARIHVFGPVASSELSYEAIHKAIGNSVMPPRWRPRFMRILERIPVTSGIDFFRHVLMLHYCVTGQTLTNSDITFHSTPTGGKLQGRDFQKKDRMKTYMAEQALLRMVSEGDLNYKEALSRASAVSRGVAVNTGNSLQQVKLSQVVFITLCTRAAIEGGLSPEIAYSRGDAYIQDVMDCKSISDATYIGHTMYEDFIQLVHRGRSNPNLSKPIQSCCDYIELHAEEKLTLSEIAKRVGYVDYYLSRKFKTETGTSINDYIKTVKVERAKTLLIATDMSIQDICDKLNFGSRSFFSETFKEIAGMPPAAFREQNRHL